jgi:two-component system, LytTR family, sensor kinase
MDRRGFLRSTGAVPRALVLLVAWSIPGVLSAVQVWLLSGDREDPLAHYLAQIPPWWLWAAATPALARLAERFPLFARRGIRHLPVHIAAVIVMDAAHAAVFYAVASLVGMQIATLSLPYGWWLLALKMSFVVVLAYTAVLAIQHALALRRTRAELEVQLARAQLDAMRFQIQPHFLFNTLNTIAMQIRTGEPDAAVDMVSTLGALLRETIDATDPEITLAHELQTVRRWLEIEQVRFGERLRVTWDVAPECEAARVPAFVLQPLVENALRHGLAQQPDGGEVTIRARRVADQLHLEVLDDGAGLRGPLEARVGLANVRERLACLYPNAHALSVCARDDGRGVRAAVAMPFAEVVP